MFGIISAGLAKPFWIYYYTEHGASYIDNAVPIVALALRGIAGMSCEYRYGGVDANVIIIFLGACVENVPRKSVKRMH